ILAKLYFACGKIEAMWNTLTAARQLASQSENQRRIRMVNAVTAEIQLRQGQLVTAQQTLSDLPPDPEDRLEQENPTLVRLFLAQGKAEEAHNLLHELGDSAEQQGRLATLITIYIFQALADHALHRSSAFSHIERALSLAVHLGYRRVFLNEGQIVADL